MSETPAHSAPFYDAHNHLQDAWLTPHRRQLFADLAAAGVRRAVVNGTCEADWPEVAQLASAHAVVHPSFGVHPWDAGNRSADWQSHLLKQLDAHPRAGIGEIGLDRWILESARPSDPRLAGLRRAPLVEQTEVFRWQLALAAERNLPASVHCLEAFGPMYETLRACARPARGFLLHAYSGPAEMVANFAQLGAYFSFNGSFLHSRKSRYRAVYAAVPSTRLLVETDAPAMRLPPDREAFPPLPAENGNLANHPANLTAAYAGLAAWRNTDLSTLRMQVADNYQRLFGA